MPTRKSNFKYLRFIVTLAILRLHTDNLYLRYEEEHREQHHRRGAGGP